MVFGGGPLNTLKLFLTKLFFYQGTSRIYFLWFQKKLTQFCWTAQYHFLLHSKAIIYLRYKKVFLDENPKTRFSEKKYSNKQQKYKNILKKISWVIWYKNYWSYLFYEDVVIYQRTLMFKKNYWVRTGFVVVWYTLIWTYFSNRYASSIIKSSQLTSFSSSSFSSNSLQMLLVKI